MTGERARAANAAIAGNYDALVYDPERNPLTDPRIIFGHAAVFGQVRKPSEHIRSGGTAPHFRGMSSSRRLIGSAGLRRMADGRMCE